MKRPAGGQKVIVPEMDGINHPATSKRPSRFWSY
jgi:hypothetical protein